MKLSLHGKLRMEERAKIDTRNQKPFYANALKKGISPGNIKDGPLKDFLLSKEKKNCKVKLYRGFVFIYSRNSKQLYTMYELPKELKDEQN